MCGFAGFIDFKGAGDEQLVEAMAATLIHRGPDDAGTAFFQEQDTVIGLGFRRLSIIDLSPAGHQPMHSGDEQVTIMMNGEVYNYASIRKELEQEGCSFRSGSDTEVVLQAYCRWGLSALSKFIGMFAIVLLDRSSKQLILIRDRAGVKPLFYHVHPSGVLFGSELKAFHRHPAFTKKIDQQSLHTYFYNGNIPAPFTIFENTFKVCPGEYVIVDLKSGLYRKETYWDVMDVYNKPVRKISYEDALDETERILQDAFNYRMVADVPVGVFLSGGYDSTAVTALLAKSVSGLNTYTIGFEDTAYDESPHAAAVAAHLGTQHHHYTCTDKEAMEIIPQLPWIYDEPFGDSSAIPTTLVSRVARRHVTVALSADAGDELFAGYPRHRKVLSYFNRLQKYPAFVRDTFSLPSAIFSRLHISISHPNRFEKLLHLLRSKDILEAFHVINQTYTDGEVAQLINASAGAHPLVFGEGHRITAAVSPLNQLLAVEYKSYLVDDILQKVDRATMSASLEGREPFLDHRVVEWVAQLPDDYKLKGAASKKILKDIVHKYVPATMVDRPKMGFGVPVKNWMRNELRDLFESIMGDEVLIAAAGLNVHSVKVLKRAYLEGKLADFERVWFVFAYLQWYKYWMS